MVEKRGKRKVKRKSSCRVCSAGKEAKMKLWDVIKETIKKAGTPLSPKEIWDKSEELETRGDFSTTGKTPWNTIGAYIYMDIQKNGDSSIMLQVSKMPARFFIRELADNIDMEQFKKQEEEQEEKESTKKLGFDERDLHPIVVAYAAGDIHFKAHLKTVYHEKTKQKPKGQNRWVHPDIVGVYFPFNDYKSEICEVQKSLSVSTVKLYSFEVKIKLTINNHRECYFQSVSNSSWANEGYLVTLNIDEGVEDEIRRLNNAFGIGLIKLDIDNVYESEILFPSRINQEIDWDTVNNLADMNEDFKEFLEMIKEDCQNNKVKSEYDKILEHDKIIEHIKKEKICYTS